MKELLCCPHCQKEMERQVARLMGDDIVTWWCLEHGAFTVVSRKWADEAFAIQQEVLRVKNK